MKERRYPPMLLRETSELPLGADWGYEAKFDGFRIMADAAAPALQLVSRGGHDFTQRYPAVAQELPAALQGRSAVLDGEMVGFNNTGNEDYNVLRRKLPTVVYHIFDLLELDGQPIIDQPLWQRRARLDDLLQVQPHVTLSPVFTDRDATLSAVRQQHMEGVVAKHANSVYQPGMRSRDWLKQILIKHPQGFKH